MTEPKAPMEEAVKEAVEVLTALRSATAFDPEDAQMSQVEKYLCARAQRGIDTALAALIRSAPAPGREEISNEIHIALQRLHYADLSWIAGSADGFERATLAIADHLLSALFHAPLPAEKPHDRT